MKYRLSIPKPCHENWHEMTPAERGRFCDSCKKNVFDFTKHSPQQLFGELEAKGKICGRFRPDQLNRDLNAAPAKRGFSFQWMLSSALIFGGFQKVGAQDSTNFELGKIAIHQNDSSFKSSVSAPALPIDSMIVRGVVSDKETKEAIPFVNVFIEGTQHGVPTDTEGKFELSIPKDSTFLNVQMIGYVNQKILFTPSQESTFLNIELHNDVALMGDVCIVPPTLWQRIGNWFKRVF